MLLTKNSCSDNFRLKIIPFNSKNLNGNPKLEEEGEEEKEVEKGERKEKGEEDVVELKR